MHKISSNAAPLLGATREYLRANGIYLAISMAMRLARGLLTGQVGAGSYAAGAPLCARGAQFQAWPGAGAGHADILQGTSP